VAQEAFFVVGVDQLHDTYLGTPILSHVNWAFLGHRIYRLGQNRSYIYLPFLITIIASSLFGVGGNDRSCLSTDVFRFG
jgi:hypothetical protein